MQADAGSLLVKENDVLVRKVARGLDPKILTEAPISRSFGGISWQAMTDKKPIIVPDISKVKIASKTLTESPFTTLVCIPMIVRERAIGVISIYTKTPRTYTEQDLNLFAIVANQTALAILSIKTSEVLEENKLRLAELEALNQVSKSISTLFNFEETLYSIIGLITHQLRGERGVIALIDTDDKKLKALRPAYNLGPSQIDNLICRSDEGALGEAFYKGVPIVVNEIDKETHDILARAKINDTKSILVAPLRVKSQTLGVVVILSEKEKNFTKNDLRLLSILASQAAIVVNSALSYRQVEEAKKKDEALLISIGEGVVAVDDTEQIILFNPAGEKITGFDYKDVLKKNIDAVFSPQNDEKIKILPENSPIKKVLKDGKAQHVDDIYLQNSKGNYFPARISVAPTFDADDKIIGAIIVFSDITKEREVEHLKQELISIATHELRTPLTAFKGYLDMILDGTTGGVNQETQETVLELINIWQKMTDLVEDLLNVGRIEQGRMEYNPQLIDINNLIEMIVGSYKSQAKVKNIKVTYTPIEIDKIKVDSNRVRQVLENLISNALKYTEKGEVKVNLQKKDNDVVFNVSDTGLGVSKADQKNLFTKFTRIKTEKTRKITGSGLGLWICKTIVEKMGGKIWLVSDEGKGSTFSFSLPIK